MSNRKKRKDELVNKEPDSLAEQPHAPLAVPDEAKTENKDPREAEIDNLRKELAEKKELAQAYFAQLQRVQADFENYQKRIEGERARIAGQACEAIVSGLLDTLDNFERALAHLEKMPAEESKGVLMVYENMLAYLGANGLEKIVTSGCQFDPRRHEAIMQEDADCADGEVLQEFQAGYMMNGRVIRPSKVKVARQRKQNEDINISKEE